MDSLFHFIDKVKIKNQINFLNIHLDQKFSALSVSYRKEIRNQIVTSYEKHLSIDEQKNILNIDLYPKSKNLFFSISHCPLLGGFVVSDQPIGFDLELSSRISAGLIQRICTKDEITAVSDFKYLWCAKESVLKLNPDYLLLSNVKVINWEQESYFETVNESGFILNYSKEILLAVAFKRKHK